MQNNKSGAPEGAYSSAGLLALEDVKYEIQSDLPNRCTKLSVVLLKSGWIIKGIILENEQLFKGNSGVHY